MVAARISGSLIDRPRSVTAQTPLAEFSSAAIFLRYVRAQWSRYSTSLIRSSSPCGTACCSSVMPADAMARSFISLTVAEPPRSFVACKAGDNPLHDRAGSSPCNDFPGSLAPGRPTR